VDPESKRIPAAQILSRSQSEFPETIRTIERLSGEHAKQPSHDFLHKAVVVYDIVQRRII